MKTRLSFVTNSSSSSYIICFARIEDEEKAKPIIDKYNLDVFDVNGVKDEMRYGELGADWAGAIIWGTDEILEAYPDDKYVIIEDWLDADYDEDSYEPIYDYDFEANAAIEEITEANGFVNIEVSEGEGRNG